MAHIVNMPRLGLNEDTSVMGEWFVSVGDQVKEGDALFSFETDKSTMTVYAEAEGVVLKRFYDNYDVVSVMTPVCVIGDPGENVDDIMPVALGEAPAVKTEEPEVKEAKQGGQQKAAASSFAVEAKLSPRAKKLAQVNGIDARGILPSGAESRIIEQDIIGFMKTGIKGAVAQPATTQRREKLSNIRKIIAKNMVESLQNTAQLTSHMIYNASRIQKKRGIFKNGEGEEKGITINDMVLFAVVKALLEHPVMNAHLLGDEMVFFDHVNLGFAVDTDRGLMVPTICNAEGMSLLELSQKGRELAKKCREGTILPDEMADATFTVSNLGGIGVVEFTPILNPPQVGILGIGTIDFGMKKTEEGILYYPTGHLSLTYDHRAVDGAPSARFLKTICEKLEALE